MSGTVTAAASGPLIMENPAEAFASARLLNALQQNFNKRAQAATEAIQSGYQHEVTANTAFAEKWTAVKTNTAEAKDLLERTAGRIQSMRARIDAMIQTVVKAEQNAADPTGAAGYSAAYDALLRSYDNSARSATYGVNLLGEARTTLTYQSGIYGTTETVRSAYVGSDYHIIDSEGKYWDLNRAARTLKRYDSYPDDPTSVVGNLDAGLVLDDLTGDSISFTVGSLTATPQSFTGTLNRSGIELLDAWAYDNLATAEGRSRALADATEAKKALDVEIRRYKVSAQIAEFYGVRAEQALDGYTKANEDLMIDLAAEIEKTQKKLTADYEVIAKSLSRSLVLQNQYAKMFKSGSTGTSKIDSLLDLLA